MTFGGTAPAKTVCGFSTETASQSFLPKSLVTRNCGCRVQTKPGMNWASIIGAMISLRGVIPLPFSVASDQDCPASRCQPDVSQSAVTYRLRSRGVKEFDSLELADWAAPRKSISP